MSEVELSKIVVEGLRCLDSSFNSELTKKIISNAVKMSLHSDASKFIQYYHHSRSVSNHRLVVDIPANPEIYASKADLTKQAEYAVLTLLLLAIKFDLDDQQLRELLESHKISGSVIEELISVYEKNKSSLRVKNLTTGLSLPHVTDVEWKLTCDVKSSNLDTLSGALNFRINLGRFKEITGERETITEFVCNVEELQLLIGRLKEIERHCEKVGNAK